ncbi:hypothetical protein CSOJ01_06954 [Colletotrichum sojae]|uniref:Uncharacterized protein n=1 Tax=Colletotrichum sojae TaxID=2175907 RepID=A0A8H6JAZ5_9PEZI|nr:hypothetical protein CSOJ01_06954 [Colletotrichum sojae]
MALVQRRGLPDLWAKRQLPTNSGANSPRGCTILSGQATKLAIFSTEPLVRGRCDIGPGATSPPRWTHAFSTPSPILLSHRVSKIDRVWAPSHENPDSFPPRARLAAVAVRFSLRVEPHQTLACWWPEGSNRGPKRRQFNDDTARAPGSLGHGEEIVRVLGVVSPRPEISPAFIEIPRDTTLRHRIARGFKPDHAPNPSPPPKDSSKHEVPVAPSRCISPNKTAPLADVALPCLAVSPQTAHAGPPHPEPQSPPGGLERPWARGMRNGRR